jgi:hypothetical protein
VLVTSAACTRRPVPPVPPPSPSAAGTQPPLLVLGSDPVADCDSPPVAQAGRAQRHNEQGAKDAVAVCKFALGTVQRAERDYYRNSHLPDTNKAKDAYEALKNTHDLPAAGTVYDHIIHGAPPGRTNGWPTEFGDLKPETSDRVNVEQDLEQVVSLDVSRPNQGFRIAIRGRWVVGVNDLSGSYTAYDFRGVQRLTIRRQNGLRVAAIR